VLAIDTNVIVRFLTGDDPVQARRARRLIESETIFVSTTVLLETEWVLRSAYGYSAGIAREALASFAGLPRVKLEDAPLVAAALGWMDRGMDFADALHLDRTEGCTAFASFDRKLAKLARAVGGPAVRSP
jgi:predicted nucleic-acid-binding protein